MLCAPRRSICSMPGAFTSTKLVWVTFPGNCVSDCDQQISGGSTGKPVPSGEDLLSDYQMGFTRCSSFPKPVIALWREMVWLPGLVGILEEWQIHICLGVVCGQSFLKAGGWTASLPFGPVILLSINYLDHSYIIHSLYRNQSGIFTVSVASCSSFTGSPPIGWWLLLYPE